MVRVADRVGISGLVSAERSTVVHVVGVVVRMADSVVVSGLVVANRSSVVDVRGSNTAKASLPASSCVGNAVVRSSLIVVVMMAHGDVVE